MPVVELMRECGVCGKECSARGMHNHLAKHRRESLMDARCAPLSGFEWSAFFNPSNWCGAIVALFIINGLLKLLTEAVVHNIDEIFAGVTTKYLGKFMDIKAQHKAKNTPSST